MLVRHARGERRAAALAVVGVALAALGGGCGAGGGADLGRGKRLFTGEGRCGSCHELRRAGTMGTIGPNLDNAFAQARRDKMGTSTIENVVYDQILNPRKNSQMPRRLVTGDDARDVAAYVAEAAGRSGEDPGGVPELSPPAPGLAKGRRLFIAAGCGGCHILSDARTSASVGPQLNGVGNKARESGSPKQYIRTAILDPNAQIVAGFPANVMPQDYRKKLTAKEIDTLVDYLLRATR